MGSTKHAWGVPSCGLLDRRRPCNRGRDDDLSPMIYEDRASSLGNSRVCDFCNLYYFRLWAGRRFWGFVANICLIGSPPTPKNITT